MLKLVPNPTFKHPVAIPVPGEKPKKVEFVFKHKKKSELNEFFKEAAVSADDAKLLEIVAGWKKSSTDGDNGLDTEFSDESFVDFLQNYPGAGSAIFDGYVEAMTKGRQGN